MQEFQDGAITGGGVPRTTWRRCTRRPGRVGFGRAIAGLALLVAIALPGGPATAEPLPLSARPLDLRSDRPDAGRIGPLIWRGGLELRSPDRRFGGLSGLLVAPDGSRITAVSDRGDWISVPLVYGAGGHLVGVGAGTIAPLRGPGGAGLHEKWDRDAESLAELPDGSLVVAFEHNHRLWRYPAGPEALSRAPVPLPGPKGLEHLGRNSGIEALAELSGGALLAIAEGREQDDESAGFLWRDGAWSGLVYDRSGEFRPTGAARLPDGDILVLERRFNMIDGLGIRLVRVPQAAVGPGARLHGEVIALLEPPVALDNMEGLAARRNETGETLIYLISDDNFSAMQRTLLLVFALRG